MPTTLTLESNCGSSTEWRDRDLGGEVEDHLRLGVGEQPDQVGVDDVGLGELEVVVTFGLAEVLAAPRAEVVDADDGVSVRQQAVYQR